MEYTPEQQKDILERIKEASEALKKLDLTPSAYITKEPIGPNMFADQVTVFLQDLKYKKDVESPKESVGTATKEGSDGSKGSDKAGGNNKA